MISNYRVLLPVSGTCPGTVSVTGISRRSSFSPVLFGVYSNFLMTLFVICRSVFPALPLVVKNGKTPWQLQVQLSSFLSFSTCTKKLLGTDGWMTAVQTSIASCCVLLGEVSMLVYAHKVVSRRITLTLAVTQGINCHGDCPFFIMEKV